MDLSAINTQIDQVLSQLKAEGLLDEQFSQLMALQDDSNPDFVAEVRQGTAGLARSAARERDRAGLASLAFPRSPQPTNTSFTTPPAIDSQLPSHQ